MKVKCLKIKDLKVGDIIFMRGKGFVSTSISLLTRIQGIDFSHVAIYVGNGKVFDTVGNTKRTIKNRSQYINYGGSDIRDLKEVLSDTKPIELGVARFDYNFSRQKMLDVCDKLKGRKYTSLLKMIAPYSAHFDLKIYSSKFSPIWFKNTITFTRNMAKSDSKMFKIHSLSRGDDQYCSSLAICCIQYYLGHKIQVLRNCEVDLIQLSPNDLFEQCELDKKFDVFFIEHPRANK
ncbi:C40 family peptidase [Vibrio parahaemolyticus]|uniref:C40 family peptidase n=1 Tax=Vibrio parahaemolyticus TaxID=670 RepID=UPI001E2F9B20|nr:C40 family peptidase [Vibrio parahaemolyticus]MCS0066944.1 C40 family peptidase [Vibrio parahaemolyticus]